MKKNYWSRWGIFFSILILFLSVFQVYSIRKLEGILSSSSAWGGKVVYENQLETNDSRKIAVGINKIWCEVKEMRHNQNANNDARKMIETHPFMSGLTLVLALAVLLCQFKSLE